MAAANPRQHPEVVADQAAAEAREATEAQTLAREAMEAQAAVETQARVLQTARAQAMLVAQATLGPGLLDRIQGQIRVRLDPRVQTTTELSDRAEAHLRSLLLHQC